MPCLILIFLRNKTKDKDKDHVSCLLFCPSATHDSNGKFHFIEPSCNNLGNQLQSKIYLECRADPVEIVLFYFILLIV